MTNLSNVGFKNIKKGCEGKSINEIIDVSFLEGKRIIRAGLLDRKKLSPGLNLEEGGFAIDYEDGVLVKRAVFGFNDLGFWITWHGEFGKENEDDKLRTKICSVWDELCCQEISIVDKPFDLMYIFVGANGNELLSLSLHELKIMSDYVRSNFCKSGSKDVEKIINDIGIWAFN